MGRAKVRGPLSASGWASHLRCQGQVEILGISHGSLYAVRGRPQVSGLSRLALPPAASCPALHPHGTGVEDLEWSSNLGG